MLVYRVQYIECSLSRASRFADFVGVRYMAVTIYDIAREVQVSHTTVSRVLSGNQNPFISEATKKKVYDAAKRMKYRPNRIARGFLKGKTKIISVVVPSLKSSFVAEVVYNLEKHLTRHGYNVFLANTLGGLAEESDMVNLHLEYLVDGVILIPAGYPQGLTPQWIKDLVGEGVSIVTVDKRAKDSIVDCVANDDVCGARRAVEHLIGHGHCRIAHIGAGESDSTSQNRLLGYRQALEAHGLGVDGALIAGSTYEDTDVGDAVKSFFQLKDRPTAIFAANDFLAGKAIQTIRYHGLRVPEDVAVMGYGNLEFSTYFDISTVSQNASELGRLAAMRLLERTQNRDLPPRDISVPTELVVRKSCGSH